MGMIQTKIVQPNGPIPQMHDPSSQSSQLNAKCARKYRDLNQNPKVAKIWGKPCKITYLGFNPKCELEILLESQRLGRKSP
jgi:hypothetical protein